MNNDPAKSAVHGFLQLGFFIGGGGLFLLFLQPPDSPEYVLSLCSTLMGAFLILGSIALLRFLNRP